MSICWGIDLDTFFLLHFLHVFQILFPRHSIQRMPLNIAQRETLPSSFLLFVWLEHFGMATFHCKNISRFVTHVSISVSGVSLKSSFMKISPILTHLGREYRQETTNNQPTKQSQHHPSHVVVNASLQIPCLELRIYAVHIWEQEIHLLASKGFIIALVDYEMLLCFPFPRFTSVTTVESQHSKLHYSRSSLSTLFSSTSSPTHTFFSNIFSPAFETCTFTLWAPWPEMFA